MACIQIAKHRQRQQQTRHAPIREVSRHQPHVSHPTNKIDPS